MQKAKHIYIHTQFLFYLKDIFIGHVELASTKNIFICFSSLAQIPQHVGEEIARQQRKKEIQDKKLKFVWIEKAKPGDKAWMMPRIIGTDNYETLNSFLKNEDVRSSYLDEMRSTVKMNTVIEVIKSNSTNFFLINIYRLYIIC